MKRNSALFRNLCLPAYAITETWFFVFRVTYASEPYLSILDNIFLITEWLDLPSFWYSAIKARLDKRNFLEFVTLYKKDMFFKIIFHFKQNDF